MATFFFSFFKIIEGGQNPGSTLAKAGPFSIPLAKGGGTDERSLAVRCERPGVAVCGLNSAGQYAKGDGLLAKLELEVPDEIKLAQAEVELTPAFMTQSEALTNVRLDQALDVVLWQSEAAWEFQDQPN